MTREHYVAVLNDLEEFGEFNTVIGDHNHELNKRNLCEYLVRRLGLRTPRNNPRTVSVKVFHLQLVKGKVERRSAGAYEIELPFERMASDEYDVELQKVLNEIPAEFWPFVRSESYERGHPSGYEEVVSIARDLVHDLKPCIEAFRELLCQINTMRNIINRQSLGCH